MQASKPARPSMSPPALTSLDDRSGNHPVYKKPWISSTFAIESFHLLKLTSCSSPDPYNFFRTSTPFQAPDSRAVIMKFSASTLAFFVSAALAVAVPESAPMGMVARDVSGTTLVGRSFPCASNDPTTCCAVRNLPQDQEVLALQTAADQKN